MPPANNLEKNIYISLLHHIGFSHADLRKLSQKNTNFIQFFEKVENDTLFLLEDFWEKKQEKIAKNLKKLNKQSYFTFLQNNNISICTQEDENFPKNLNHIAKVPFIIYFKGNIKTEDICISIVWSRKNTTYGTKALRKITDEILYENISIISGGAYGIDSLAHSIAIEKKWHTIAVFGCGIDYIYPSTNKPLFEKILQNNGGLMSIFPIGNKPETFYFPIRNEIVAGLSDIIVIPEASEKSGTLITARLALELGKEVFAIPGDIFRETSLGCNNLIKKWEAHCLLSANDIFDTMHISPKKLEQSISKNTEKMEKKFSSEIAKNIFTKIFDGHNSMDALVIETGIPIETLAMELTMLELNGDISCNSIGQYECIF